MKVLSCLTFPHSTSFLSRFLDLQTLLAEVAGDVELAATRISEGLSSSLSSIYSSSLRTCLTQVTLNNGARSLAKRRRNNLRTSLTKTPSPVEAIEVEEAVVVDEVVQEGMLLVGVLAQEAQVVVASMAIILYRHPRQALQLLLPPHRPRLGLMHLPPPACRSWTRRTVLFPRMEKRGQALKIPLHLGWRLPRQIIHWGGQQIILTRHGIQRMVMPRLFPHLPPWWLHLR